MRSVLVDVGELYPSSFLNRDNVILCSMTKHPNEILALEGASVPMFNSRDPLLVVVADVVLIVVRADLVVADHTSSIPCPRVWHLTSRRPGRRAGGGRRTG